MICTFANYHRFRVHAYVILCIILYDKNPISPQKDDGEKQSLKEKMQAMQEITLKVQMGLGMLAHILESIGNAFNFSVPFLSWLLFTVLCIVTTVLYYVPLR